MNTVVLEVKNLTKKFGDFTAVNNISFHLKEGEILGFLGVNGAGKTTTIQMLLGVLTPTEGNIHYFGKDLKTNRSEIMERVNFSSTYVELPWNITTQENLNYISLLYKIENRKKRIQKIIELFQLEKFLNKQVGYLSAGQKTRVNLAKAFINYPNVLLLDEPTASLDVEIAEEMRKIVLKERNEFKTAVLLTSHNMAEVEEMCDRIIVIHSGKIIANDAPEFLAKSIQISHVTLHLSKEKEKFSAFCDKKKLAYKKSGKSFTVDINEQDIASFLQEITKSGIVYDEISIEKPTLEDYFLQTVGKEKK